jgi:hypothetical protein
MSRVLGAGGIGASGRTERTTAEISAVRHAVRRRELAARFDSVEIGVGSENLSPIAV